MPSFGQSQGRAQATTFDLVSHRAVYELTLLDSARDSGIDDAAGLFIFEVNGSSCAGWTMSSDMILSIQGRGGNSIRTQTSYRAFEDGAGEVFTFQTNTETNDEEPIAVTGAAERRDDGELTIRRFADGESNLNADAQTLFPNQLTEALLASAEQGDGLVFLSVFDGSHETGLAQPVTAIIGEPTDATVIQPRGAQRRDIAQGDQARQIWDGFAAPRQAWPIRLSYFDPLETDAGPSFQVSYTLDTNGVSDALVLDYGSFTLRGVLAAFEPFRPESCTR